MIPTHLPILAPFSGAQSLPVPGWEVVLVMAFTVVVIALYAWERFAIEIVAAGAVTFLLLLFHFAPVEGFGPNEILAGFASPALISVMALLVVAQGIYQTGAFESPARRLAAMARQRPKSTLVLVLAVVFVISAFLNNTPVVLMFLPVMSVVASRLRMPPSRVMIPLSYVSVLAGMTTLIGSSTNLLVAEVAMDAAGLQLGFFEPGRMGLVLAAAGAVYLALAGPLLLPHRHAPDGETSKADSRQFIAQLEVAMGDRLAGAKAEDGVFEDLKELDVRMILRGDAALRPPFRDVTLQPGDVVVVFATKAQLGDLLSAERGMRPSMFTGARPLPQQSSPGDMSIVEAAVAPGSRLVGRSLAHTSFSVPPGCVVIGVRRASRMVRNGVVDIRLEPGDVLLVLGDRSELRALRDQRDVLALEWSAHELPKTEMAHIARLIFGGVILAASTQMVEIVHAAVAGAALMLMTGCLRTRQAARAFDLRIYLLAGSSFAIAGAMQATGAASLIASSLVWIDNPLVLLSFLFLLVALLTNILSNNATAILFTPIAISVAAQANADPLPFVLAVLLAANCSFATPIAYQTNLLVLGPGRYLFRDFIRIGGPMVVLLWAVFTLCAPLVFAL